MPKSITMQNLVFGLYSFFSKYPIQVRYTENELKGFLLERREKYPLLLVPIFAACRSEDFSLARAIRDANYQRASIDEVIDALGINQSSYQIRERCRHIFLRTGTSRFSKEQLRDLETLSKEFEKRFSIRSPPESRNTESKKRFESLFQ